MRTRSGWVYYQREFFVPNRWKSERRVILRFDSVHYFGAVYLNGRNVVNHTGGEDDNLPKTVAQRVPER